MAVKVSDLPNSGDFNGQEQVLVVQDGVSKAGLLSSLTPYLSSQLVTYDKLDELSIDWEETYTTVQASSGGWEYTKTYVQDNSASWDADLNVVNEFQASSGGWDSTYTTVSSNSASWGIGTDTIYDDSLLQAASGDWNNTYTTVSANSASWDAHTDPYDDTLLQSSSSNWDSSYTTVSTNSASWVGGGGGGSSIVASYVDNAFAINKPTSADVIVPVTGLSYEMQSGTTYYVKVFVLSTTSFGSDEEFIYLSHTPWAATGGVKEGLVGKHWSDLGLGVTDGGLNSGMTQYGGSWYEPTAASHQTARSSSTYAGFSEIEGFITAPSTATFTPTISYLGTPTGSMNVRVQGVIMEMP